MRHRRRIVVALIVVVVGFVGLRALRRQLFPLPLDRCATRRFDAVAWKDSAQAYSNVAVRGCMVDDLLDGPSLRGKTRTEVVALLGEPTPTTYFADYDLVYWLGQERGFISIDSEWLLFRVDKRQRVTEYKIATD